MVHFRIDRSWWNWNLLPGASKIREGDCIRTHPGLHDTVTAKVYQLSHQFFNYFIVIQLLEKLDFRYGIFGVGQAEGKMSVFDLNCFSFDKRWQGKLVKLLRVGLLWNWTRQRVVGMCVFRRLDVSRANSLDYKRPFHGGSKFQIRTGPNRIVESGYLGFPNNQSYVLVNFWSTALSVCFVTVSEYLLCMLL